MFLKQYNYKPNQGNNATSAVDTSQPAEDKPNVTTANARRRSSATEKFAGLSGYKRNSQDTSDRKASFADQKPGGTGGVLGGMWNSFTKGS